MKITKKQTIKQNLKPIIKPMQKPAIPALLAASCIGVVLSGCASEERVTVEPPVVVEVSEGDTQLPASAADASSTVETEHTDAAKETQPDSANTQTPAASTQNLYEQFLNNEISAAIRDDYDEVDYRDPIVEKGNSYNLTELGACVSKYFLNPEYTDKTSYDYAQYAYVPCPDSADKDAKNLLVKFVGLNIYSPDDDSYAVFILNEDNGQLYITDEYQCWARSDAIAYANGTLSDFGSAGAGDNFLGLSIISSNGKRESIYSAEELFGWWTSIVSDSIYNEIFGSETEPSSLVVTIYSIGDTKYYQYNIEEGTEEENEACETYINRCRDEQGIHWVTGDEIQTALQNRCSALGIDFEVTKQKEEAVWNTISSK